MPEMPFNQEVESAVIGCMIMDADRVVPLAIQFGVEPECFYTGRFQQLARGILEMHADPKRRVESVTLRDFMFRVDPDRDYLQDIIHALDSTPTTNNAEYYLDLLMKYHLRRQVMVQAAELQVMAADMEDAERLVMEAPERFSSLLKRVDKQATNADLLDEVSAEWRLAKQRRDAGEEDVYAGLPTPFPKLNSVLCGLCPGPIIISGRPSQGKTTLEDNLMTHLAENKIPVGRVTMDMTKKRLLARALCRKAGVSMAKLKFGFAGESQHAQVEDAKRVVRDYPWHFLERKTNLKVIMSWMRSMVLHEGCQALSLDYIQQIMTGDSRKDNDENGRIGYVSSSLKALSLELNVPLIAVSQLSRAGETQDREPKLSDLRGSGSLEQDAVSVIMVYQDKKVERKNNRRPTWVDVQKQQDGETMPIEMWLYEKYFRFEEAEECFGEIPEVEEEGASKARKKR